MTVNMSGEMIWMLMSAIVFARKYADTRYDPAALSRSINALSNGKE